MYCDAHCISTCQYPQINFLKSSLLAMHIAKEEGRTFSVLYLIQTFHESNFKDLPLCYCTFRRLWGNGSWNSVILKQVHIEVTGRQKLQSTYINICLLVSLSIYVLNFRKEVGINWVSATKKGAINSNDDQAYPSQR